MQKTGLKVRLPYKEPVRDEGKHTVDSLDRSLKMSAKTSVRNQF